jgi:predicted ArsR family transcriptional regulator
MNTVKMPIIKGMKGMTISEMADKLKLPKDTIRRRLLRAGIKPFSQEALYTEKDFEKIREVAPVGRPKKAAAPEKPASKAKKTK